MGRDSGEDWAPGWLFRDIKRLSGETSHGGSLNATVAAVKQARKITYAGKIRDGSLPNLRKDPPSGGGA